MRAASLGLALLALASTAAIARGGGGGGHSHSSGGDHVVSGYTRSNGTHVESYHATNPNNTNHDNYSTQGNVNPYTGKAGTKAPD